MCRGVARQVLFIMVVYTMFINNKAGGLIFQTNFVETGQEKAKVNDYLQLASIFDSMYAIARRMSPVKHGGNPACGGIQQLETDQFTLHCLRTHTGLKFFILTDPHSLGASKFLQNSYQLYTDYVLKNPFYQLDQPIQEKLFNEMLIQMAELERVGRINEFDWP